VVLHRRASTGSALGLLAVALALVHTLHRGPYSRPLLLAAVGAMLAAGPGSFYQHYLRITEGGVFLIAIFLHGRWKLCFFVEF